MPYAIERLDRSPVIRIFRPASMPMTRDSSALRDHAASHPSVGHTSELRLGITVDPVVDDHCTAYDVGHLAVADREAAQGGLHCSVAFAPGKQLGQVASALSTRRRAGDLPHRPGARGIGRAAIAVLVDVDAVRP